MITHLTDFPDKLSPMLVKELRQGMRAKSFTLLFLAFQGLLAFILLTAGAAASSDDAGAFASGVIFTMFAGAALFIQPMRGVSALSSEISGNTIEIMVLTRLSAWRIVFGKWIAIVSQTALILVTIVPYLILRYFFGGMNLAGEMVFLGLIFLTSMALTAIMVGLSGNATALVRMLPIVGFIFLMSTVLDLLRGGFKSFMSFCAMADTESRLAIAAYAIFITYIGWCALSHGTSVIAPIAENHSTLRRLIALGLVVATTVIGAYFKMDPDELVLIFGIILVPSVVTALTERSVLLPPVCKPFLRHGLAGRIASVVLLPGWPAGVFYATLLLSISIGGLTLAGSSKPVAGLDTQTAIGALGCLGGVMLAALLAAHFTKQESRRFTNFMVFLLASILLAVIPMILASINNNHTKYLWLFIWNPPVSLFMSGSSGFVRSEVLSAVMIVDAIILLALLATAAKAFRAYRPIISEAEAELKLPAAPGS